MDQRDTSSAAAHRCCAIADGAVTEKKVAREMPANSFDDSVCASRAQISSSSRCHHCESEMTHSTINRVPRGAANIDRDSRA
jgi:hypothetical protein